MPTTRPFLGSATTRSQPAPGSAKSTREFDCAISTTRLRNACLRKSQSETISKWHTRRQHLRGQSFAQQDTSSSRPRCRTACPIPEDARRFASPGKVANSSTTPPRHRHPRAHARARDREHLEWDRLGQLPPHLGYTNHTELPEALEKWPAPFMERVLPRHRRSSTRSTAASGALSMAFPRRRQLSPWPSSRRPLKTLAQGQSRHRRSRAVNACGAPHRDNQRRSSAFSRLCPTIQLQDQRITHVPGSCTATRPFALISSHIATAAKDLDQLRALSPCRRPGFRADGCA